jgi:ABC-type polysaccharide/polyol phosphate transport system ATPase subunit
MSTAVERDPVVGGSPALEARMHVANMGVRFDFDSLRRVLTPTLTKLRRVRATAWGLRNVDFDLAPGDALALVGPTGSGKTTLLRVMAGVLPPDEGTATIEGQVGSLLATGAGVGLWLTGRENAELLGVLGGLSLAESRASLDLVAELSQLGPAFDRPVHTYSEGMRARLGFAVIKRAQPRILLLDELFEALDHKFRAIVEEYAHEMRAKGGIVVAAGHDHPALKRMAPRALWLQDGELRADGAFAEVIDAYRATTGKKPDAA